MYEKNDDISTIFNIFYLEITLFDGDTLLTSWCLWFKMCWRIPKQRIGAFPNIVYERAGAFLKNV